MSLDRDSRSLDNTDGFWRVPRYPTIPQVRAAAAEPPPGRRRGRGTATRRAPGRPPPHAHGVRRVPRRVLRVPLREHEEARSRAGDDGGVAGGAEPLEQLQRVRHRGGRWRWCSRSSVAASSSTGSVVSACTSSADRPALHAASACGTVGQQPAGDVGRSVALGHEHHRAQRRGGDRRAGGAPRAVVGHQRQGEPRRSRQAATLSGWPSSSAARPSTAASSSAARRRGQSARPPPSRRRPPRPTSRGPGRAGSRWRAEARGPAAPSRARSNAARQRPHDEVRLVARQLARALAVDLDRTGPPSRPRPRPRRSSASASPSAVEAGPRLALVAGTRTRTGRHGARHAGTGRPAARALGAAGRGGVDRRR